MLAWWYSRPWRALWAGLPGLLLAGIYFVLVVLGWLIPTTELQDRYQAAADLALQQSDGEAADVYLRRLAGLGSAGPAVRYGLALVRELQDDLAGARAMMQGLAPEDGTGYARAHLWMVKEILRQDGGLVAESAEVIEHHLLQVLAQEPRNGEAAMLMGASLWAKGDAARARPYLEQTAQYSPEWYLPLAVLYRMQQDPVSARKAAETAAAYYGKMADSNPREWPYRLRWAECEMMLENYPRAAWVLRAGLRAADPQPFHDALVGVYLAWYAATPADAPKDMMTRLELLNQALAHGPNDTRLLTLLADLTDRDDEQGEIARRALQEALANGAAPATVHLLLGSHALSHGDLERGQMHLELAYQRAPRVPAVLNNLAWVLAEREPPELQRALELAQTATQLSDRPEFSFTLGTILARLGRNHEAIAEFESVLRASPHRSDVHQQLGDLYQELGNPELGEVFHSRARALANDGG